MRARWLVMALVLATLPTAACASTGPGPGSAAPSLADTRWDLAQLASVDQAGLVDLPEQLRATATFTADQVSGSGGCNAFFGPYRTDGSSIDIGPLGSSLMACPPEIAEIEGTYLAQLELATSFTVADGTLSLRNKAGDVVLSFTEALPTTLVGTAWEATGINNGRGGVESLVLDTTVTAQFAEDGALTGSAGCNAYTGTYEVTGEAMTIGPLATTRKACGKGVDAQEAAYLAALARVSTYLVGGDSLELRDESGALQVRFIVG